MGLDMYAFAYPEKEGQTFDNPQVEDGDGEELCYWRKHPNLHGWMERLYRSKGGEAEFNCVYVELTKEDLSTLKTVVNNGGLPETSGFFFGQSTPEDKRDDLKFIKAARKAIKDGKKVYYTSWW